MKRYTVHTLRFYFSVISRSVIVLATIGDRRWLHWLFRCLPQR